MSKLRCSIAVLLTLGIILAQGCDSGPARYSVEGTVNLDGKPLESGSICFRPQQGTTGPSAGAEIIAGKYSISADSGLLPGRYRIEITACRKGNETFIDDVTGEPTSTCVQFLPPKYNAKSELSEEISATGKNTLNFDLQLDKQ